MKTYSSAFFSVSVLVAGPVQLPAVSRRTSPAALTPSTKQQSGKTLVGQDAFGDWTTDAPGVRRTTVFRTFRLPMKQEGRQRLRKLLLDPRTRGPKLRTDLK